MLSPREMQFVCPFKKKPTTNIYCISTTKKLCLSQVCLLVLMVEFKNPLNYVR